MTFVTGAALLVLILFVAACGSSGGSSSASSSAGAAKSTVISGITVTADPTLHDMLPENIKAAGVLTNYVDTPYPPWTYDVAGSTTQYYGLEIDMIKAAAAKLGVRLEETNIDFESIITGLIADKAEMTTSEMWDTKAREKVLSFVDWAYDGAAFVVPKGNPEGITSLASFAGKVVSCQAGTSFESFLDQTSAKFVAQGKKKMTVLAFPQDTQALLAVKSGRAAAELMDAPAADYLVTTPGGSAVEVANLSDEPKGGYEAAYIGVGILKTDPQLVTAVAAAYTSLLKDGTYGKFIAKYKTPSVAVQKITVNTATS